MNTANVPIAKTLGITEMTDVVAKDSRHQVARQRQFAISTVTTRAALSVDGAASKKMNTANVMVAQITETGGLTINAETVTWHLTEKLQYVTHMDLRLVVLLITGAVGKTHIAHVPAVLTIESNKNRKTDGKNVNPEFRYFAFLM
ncbi:hypothetical protein HOLleu_23994 [Holothuria leucospilota]|uniref:Uncharacterized protein n=1 Tax=Holothuria leucospilota TaxID=206669 RepID=A0A9Q1BVS0_HOLLE|nr:hypothetical protein HOLleu_23994 [Holothuria leucospilota]